MATSSSLAPIDVSQIVDDTHIKALQMRLLSPNPATRESARKELSSLGYSISNEGKTITKGPGAAAPAEKPVRTGSLADRPAVQVSGFNANQGSRERRAQMMAAPATPATTPTQAPTAPASPLTPTMAYQGSAYAMGAPALDDRADAFGRPIAGAQTFVRGLFAAADNANKALTEYKRQNPNASSASDPQYKQLEAAVGSATAQAQAGSQWAAMKPSARQSVLTQGEVAAGRARAVDQTQQGALEQQNAERERRIGERKTTLLEDGAYYNQTGVMRGGAGEGTSTTQAGGVIRPVPVAPGAPTPRPGEPRAATLTSPYGSGSITYLNKEQQAKRPEAMIEGKPASQFFDKAAMRQGQTFDVGGNHYSPELSPADFKQRQLDEAKRKAEEERKKFAASLLKR